MATLEELERRQAQLQNQIRDKRRALAADERKARNHALMVIGGLVERRLPDSDWKCADWDALESVLSHNADVFAQCGADALPTKEAAARLREWERAQRTASRGGTAAAS